MRVSSVVATGGWQRESRIIGLKVVWSGSVVFRRYVEFRRLCCKLKLPLGFMAEGGVE